MDGTCAETLRRISDEASHHLSHFEESTPLGGFAADVRRLADDAPAFLCPRCKGRGYLIDSLEFSRTGKTYPCPDYHPAGEAEPEEESRG